eukprot:3776811-Rhodomonas_salina.2
MSGTDAAYGAANSMGCPVLTLRMGLRTVRARARHQGAQRRYQRLQCQGQLPASLCTRQLSPYARASYLLRTRYAVSGTDVARMAGHARARFLTECMLVCARAVRSPLSEFGIPVDELGFKPLHALTTTAPAGLVVS